jgi:hypothetical protein
MIGVTVAQTALGPAVPHRARKKISDKRALVNHGEEDLISKSRGGTTIGRISRGFSKES